MRYLLVFALLLAACGVKPADEVFVVGPTTTTTTTTTALPPVDPNDHYADWLNGLLGQAATMTQDPDRLMELCFDSEPMQEKYSLEPALDQELVTKVSALIETCIVGDIEAVTLLVIDLLPLLPPVEFEE